MSIGEKIKKLRINKGKTQLDVAKFAGVTYQTIYKYEKDIAVPSLDTLSRIAEYFNTTTDYLLGRVTDVKLETENNNINPQIATHVYKDYQKLSVGAKKYGYDIINKRFVINEKEAKNIKAFYEYFIKVAGDTHLSYDYFKDHFENSSYQSFHKYLKDTSYIGKYKLYLKDEYIENYIPAIVEEELFNKVQNFIKKRRRRTRNEADIPLTIFDGLLKCGKCNARMCRSLTKSTNGTIHTNYRCFRSSVPLSSKNKRFKCENKRVTIENKIEKQLLNIIQDEIKNHIIKIKIINSKKIDIKSVKEDIKRIEKKLEKLKDLYIDNLINKELYKKDYVAFMGKLENLKAKLYTNKKRVVNI